MKTCVTEARVDSARATARTDMDNGVATEEVAASDAETDTAPEACEAFDEEEYDYMRPPTGLVHSIGWSHISITEPGHPECPERVCEIMKCLKEEGLQGRCRELGLRSARADELTAVHTTAHVQNIAAVAGLKSQSKIDARVEQFYYDSVFLTQGSFKCASDASGAVLELVEQVLWGEMSNGFAVVRPPGHHAEGNMACGFSIFNHVAVAAKAAKSLGAGRVLVVDWDVHHGNGTQEIFERDSDVLFFSVHRYDNANFFPCSKAAGPQQVGQGPGEGFNVNVAWNIRKKDHDGFGDDEYLAAWQCALLPIALDFQPELILVSAGFDAVAGDPLGGCSVSPGCYAQLTRMLQSVCSKVVLVLEGGYNLAATAECAVACTRALLGDAVPLCASVRPKDEARKCLEDTLLAHRRFWPLLPLPSAVQAAVIYVSGISIEASAKQRKSAQRRRQRLREAAGEDAAAPAAAATAPSNSTVRSSKKPHKKKR